jgi:threonine dehydratase
LAKRPVVLVVLDGWGYREEREGNAIALADPAALAQRGVYTASAGNMAQGVAWNARRLGIPAVIVMPRTTPEIKINAVTALGATSLSVVTALVKSGKSRPIWRSV